MKRGESWLLFGRGDRRGGCRGRGLGGGGRRAGLGAGGRRDGHLGLGGCLRREGRRDCGSRWGCGRSCLSNLLDLMDLQWRRWGAELREGWGAGGRLELGHGRAGGWGWWRGRRWGDNAAGGHQDLRLGRL